MVRTQDLDGNTVNFEELEPNEIKALLAICDYAERGGVIQILEEGGHGILADFYKSAKDKISKLCS